MSVRAVIFDWAGTVVDFGSLAPVEAMSEAFREAGLEVSLDEVRRPMGMAKWHHIQAVLQSADVARRWVDSHGAPPDDALVDRIYERFLPLQSETIVGRSQLIEGAAEVVGDLMRQGIRIGSSTGYTAALMEKLRPVAAEQGFDPECVTTADDCTAGRPAPWMIYRNCEALGVFPMSDVVKVDDTLVGIEAGRNAGCWTVGVTGSGNLMGLSSGEYESLDPEERQSRLATIADSFRAAGAHDVIETIADLPACLDRIRNRMLSEGP